MRRIATRSITLFAILLIALGLPAMSFDGDTLNFEERVRYQRLIEDVYWQNRIWPEENPGLKPALDEVMPDAVIRERVQSYLDKSAALEIFWSRPLTGEQLQAEMDRMASRTKNPEMLTELFAALDDDPFLIAECLARPVLVDRLTRNWYARDTRFHGTLKEQAESALAVYSGDVATMPALGGHYEGTEFRLVMAEPQTTDLGMEPAEHSAIDLNAEEWRELIEQIAILFGIEPDLDEIPLGTISRLTEEDDRFVVMSVLSIGQDYLKIATVTWSKRPFDAWWADGRIDIKSTDNDDPVSSPDDGYKIRWRINSGCSDDTWTELWYLPAGRIGHTAVWTGAEMIIWGGRDQHGYLNTGGRYNPATDSWTATSIGNGVPSDRVFHTAAWTGTEMIVWGGRRYDAGFFPLNTGGRYDPATNSWTATSIGAGVPSERYKHTAVWTDSEMIIWGGTDGSDLNTGGRYDPATDSWTATSIGDGVPSGRKAHTAVWTGTEMIVWGGADGSALNTGGRYDPAADNWTATSIGAGVPSERYEHTAIWTGTEMIVWGGEESYGVYLNTGGRYDPTTNGWTATSIGENLPSERISHTAVWTGTEMIVWGGEESYEVYLNTGGRYDPVNDNWTATSIGAGVPSERYEHTAVWTGTELIIWGGQEYWTGKGSNYLINGGRYDPVNDNWTATFAGGDVPLARKYHTAVWTGAEMIVWGGLNGPAGNWGLYLNTGGRYDPATNSWTATSTGDGVLSGRIYHSAVWTGTEMIVWGGAMIKEITPWTWEYVHLNSGGRYDPASDSWTATSTEDGVPTGRSSHTAVWTGTEMIVWGGYGGSHLNTGGRYDPASDSWTATSTEDGVPTGRSSHTAVWTGTEMVVWGGQGGSYLNTGGRYDPATDIWETTSAGDGVPVGRIEHTAVWTGTEMIVWGGNESYSVHLNTGGRYDPATDNWLETSTGADVPTSRYHHTAVWTGTEMIVWGGYQYDNGSFFFNTGGRFDPASDSWTATSTEAVVPTGRSSHTAVWTGTEMIIWGGLDDRRADLSSGGLYCACDGVREREWYEIHAQPDSFHLQLAEQERETDVQVISEVAEQRLPDEQMLLRVERLIRFTALWL